MKNHKKIVLFCSTVIFVVSCLLGCISSKKQLNKNTDTVTTSQSSHNEEKNHTFDINKYEDKIWASDDLKSNTYILEIIKNEDDTISFYLRYFEHGDLGHIADILESVEHEDINGNKLSFNFDSDGYSHSGTVNMTFNSDNISVKIGNVKGSANSEWGFVEDSFTLEENPLAYEGLPSEFESTQESNLSKASEILKKMGLSVDEFKQSCHYISNNESNYVYDSNTATVHIERPDYTYKQLRQYPADYANLCCFDDNLYVCSKDKSSDGYTVYKVKDKSSYEGDIILFDKRDDIYSPTISIDDAIVPYMMFKGVQTLGGIDYVCFDLIAIK